MKTLVYIEIRDGSPTLESLGVLSRAADVGQADAILCGLNVREHAGLVSSYGASQVAVVEDDVVAQPLPQPHADAVQALLEGSGYDAVWFGGSILTADVAGILAARIEAGVNSDLTGIELDNGQWVGSRPALGDSVVVRVGWTSQVTIAIFRPGTYAADTLEGQAPEVGVVDVDVEYESSSQLTVRVEAASQSSSKTSLADAEVIVAGGRGLGSKENLQLVFDLADVLDGVSAVSMPLVSNGWAPYAMQIGQTGSVVRPKLYVACGISGQMQHKIGMERSGTIVAINNDASAPIFRFCDIGVVGDVTVVIPKFVEVVKRHRKGGTE